MCLAMTRHIDTATIRRLAVTYSVDPRSIRREMREPGSVRGMAGHRVREALASLDVVAPLAPPSTRPEAA